VKITRNIAEDSSIDEVKRRRKPSENHQDTVRALCLDPEEVSLARAIGEGGDVARLQRVWRIRLNRISLNSTIVPLDMAERDGASPRRGRVGVFTTQRPSHPAMNQTRAIYYDDAFVPLRSNGGADDFRRCNRRFSRSCVVRKVASFVGVILEFVAAHIEVRQAAGAVIDAGIAAHQAEAKVEFKIHEVSVMPE